MYNQVNDPTAEDSGYRFLCNLGCFSKLDELLRQLKKMTSYFLANEYLRHLSGRKIQIV